MTSTKLSGTRRAKISVMVRDEVLRESGYMCGNPTCRHILTLELHHMVWVKDGGGNDALNLFALCPNCHSLHTQGHIPGSAIRHWKGILHALNHAFNKESMDLLLFLHKTGNEVIWYSGDGLLKFASLISAGFVRIVETESAGSMRYSGGGLSISVSESSHRVDLADRGKVLIEAWLKGNEVAYKKAIDGVT